MKLYAWVKGDRGEVTKEANTRLVITLEYEEVGQSWECNPSKHELRLNFFLVDGKPVLVIGGNEAVRIEDNRQVAVA